MKLLARPRHETGALEGFAIPAIGEGDVNRRGAGRLAQRAQPRDQRLAGALGRIRRDEQPPARHRREGNGDLQLGVIAPARALIGLGPTVVEDIFALAMGLQVGRRRRDEPAAGIFHEHMRGRPAGTPAHRTRLLQRKEKRMRDEGIESLAVGRVLAEGGRIGAGVPRVGGDLGDGGTVRTVRAAVIGALRRRGARTKAPPS